MNVKPFFKLCAAVLAFSMSTVLNAETITLANGEWAPYMSPKLKKAGYVSDIVVKAFKKEGIDVKWVFLPWKRGYEEAKSGKFQGTAIWGYNADRAKDFLYTDTVLDLKTAFFIKKGSHFKFNTIADLKGKKLGGVIGYAYGIEDAEKAGKVKINRIAKPDANYKKLLAGRLDAVLEDSQVGLKSIHDLGMDGKIVMYKTPLKSRKYSVIVSKKVPNGPQLVAAFNAGLKKLKASGEFDAILKAAREGKYDQ
jgi:polar amino acid transport system substrate-binding protein